MPGYQSVAIVLKAFSATRGTRRLYRWLGNRVGQDWRKKEQALFYPERGIWLIDCLAELGLALTPSSRVLEVGTGWMHFYAIFLRLFSTPQITVFDVVDNRQLSALQWRFCKISEYLATHSSLDEEKINAIKELTRRIAAVSTFDELYELLGFTYRIDPVGDLGGFEENSFDLVFSFDVLEHVQRDILGDSIAAYYRVLKPGGYSIHQVALDDHMAQYVKGASPKQFLSYSEFSWKLRFENRLQHINRVPHSEYLALFENCGFEPVQVSALREPESIQGLSIAKQYRNMSLEDLEATRSFLVHRKPVGK